MPESKKIFLTGATGFIGKNLLEQISKEHDFVCPTHNELDLLDSAAVLVFLKSQKFDLVIHAANIGVGSGQANNEGVFENNTRMFTNLVSGSEHFGRMIFLGSGAEYGKQRDIIKIRESIFGDVKPEDGYGRAKYFASEYIAKHKNILNLRCFGIFGKYENYQTRFISNAISNAVLGLPIVINKNVVFDYLYINDLVSIIDYFIKHEPHHKFYNVGSGQFVDLVTIANLVKEISQKDLEIIIKNSGLNREYTCDNSLLKEEIPGLSFTPIRQSITELYTWYNNNQYVLDKALLSSQI